MFSQIEVELREEAEAWEQVLIGSVINGGDIEIVKGMINASSFVNPHNRIVWETMVHLSNKNTVPTHSGVAELLKNHAIFNNSVDMQYAIRGNQDMGVPVFIKRSAASLSKAHTRYHLGLMCDGVINEIGSSELEVPTDKLLLDVRDAVDKMKAESGFDTTDGITVTTKMLENIQNPPAITKTIFNSYNKILGGGFMAGETYTLAGANKSGKTMMAGTISAGLNAFGVRHGYWCLEMGSLQIMQRMVAMRANFPTYHFMHDDIRSSTGLANKIIDHQGFQIDDHNHIVFTDCPMLTAGDAKMMLYRAKMDGCEGVIIDYFSLISPDIGFKGNQNEHQDTLAQELTKIAKDLGIWILMIAQTNAAGSTYGSAALLKASTHIAVLERVEDAEASKNGFRWLRTISSRLTMSQDIGSETEPGLRVHHNGSHIEEVFTDNNFQDDFI